MSQLDARERPRVAKAITHFLLSLDKSDGFDLDVIDLVAAEQGEELVHAVGCVACHSPRGHQVTHFALGGEGVLRTDGRTAEAVAVIHRALDQGVNYCLNRLAATRSRPSARP